MRVFVTSQLPGSKICELAGQHEVTVHTGCSPLGKPSLIERLPEADAVVALLGDIIDGEVMTACPQLKVVANVAVGFDNIDVAAATREGILVTNTPGVLDNATADLAFGLLLACARRIAEADRFVRKGQWTRWTPDLMLGSDVAGKTLGIVGFGRIGQAVARRARGFDMHVIYTRREKNPVSGYEFAQLVSLEQLLQQAHFISIHCPLSKDTCHLIGQAEFRKMRSDAILVNTARGPVVDEPALVSALAAGTIAGAGLDVFEREPQIEERLMQLPNVVLTPHIGSATRETRAAMADLAAGAVISALSGQLPANAVNPQVWPRVLARIQAAQAR